MEMKGGGLGLGVREGEAGDPGIVKPGPVDRLGTGPAGESMGHAQMAELFGAQSRPLLRGSKGGVGWVGGQGGRGPVRTGPTGSVRA